ncbi:hydroxyisourate hydrolase [Bacillus sp. ISL-40]|uniref:hydroxyisourate hydrolase n=1 Tax=unclassified Bacillus (in: firmicutes) TaxID=185979 RepID=UPI001BEC5AB3|nr:MULTISPECIES: hydroxyisourate hydrolase [unclassified Bacillus (in: firmicutes)]MBT2697403.1 hydroxyisourate hydrolase [Bacillus sp. ISL-40]MBT2723903.1 hydroxyisourate hydrolase [Bacillus sp. ISL-46]MBT2741781.1 hydroxyisourate hydrolase [Bacillus sp. ISL-77]
MTGKVTTHVLDLSLGKPASGVLVELWQVIPDNKFEFIQISYTNEDGRVNQPLLEGASMKKGIYEIRFHVGDYFSNRSILLGDPSFLDCVPVRFGISETASHYHVPLLISPGGYSTYRGS